MFRTAPTLCAISFSRCDRWAAGWRSIAIGQRDWEVANLGCGGLHIDEAASLMPKYMRGVRSLMVSSFDAIFIDVDEQSMSTFHRFRVVWK